MKVIPQLLRALLVAESNEDATPLIEALKRGGYEPDWERVETETALRKALVSKEWDVVFCDYSMPDLDARRTLRILRETGDTLTAIVVSGQAGEEVAVEAMRLGANDFVLKNNIERIVPAIERELAASILRRERQAATIALRESEERHRVLFDRSPLPMWVYDPKTLNYLAVNEMAVREYGYTREEYLAMSLRDLRLPEDVAELLQSFSSMKNDSDYLPQATRRHRKKDGTIIIVEIADQAITFNGVTARVVQAADITEARRAADQIREQAALLDHAQDAIVVQNLEGDITYWNKSAERVFGWTAEEALGRKAPELLYENPVIYHEAFDATLLDGDWVGEVRKLTKTGGQVLVAARWTLLRNDSGEPQAVLVINTDVTEKKQMEVQFFRAQRMGSIGTLAGGIAHDLNNVLGPIIMGVDLMKVRATDPQDINILNLMEMSGQRGVDLVRQVLFFARGIEGRRGSVSAIQLVRDLETIACETFPKSITIEVEAPEDTWNMPGDKTQFHQVLLNLCVNARDAMPAGGRLRISAHNRQIDEQFAATQLTCHPGSYVALEVSDTGIGMAPEVVARMFEPFFTTKELGHGTGLGLSTTDSIIKNHGGFVIVQSEPGKGTTFQVFLPAEIAPIEIGDPAIPLDLPRGNGELILIIDDEASIRSITGETLAAFGYRTLSASDGAEGVATYAQHAGEIAVVLTDMMMPVMGGAATVRVLLRLDPQVQIIIASGSSSKTMEAEVAEMGVKFFMPKPYNAETLLQTLHQLLHPKD
ncbi:MAG: PAS domain S-box protein [Chthoniobacterales bacterium]